MPKKGPKILIFDIESTNLTANFGFMLCFGYKWRGQKKVHVPTIRDFPGKNVVDDSGLVAHVREIINSADLLISYNGRRFDIPFIDTRCLAHRLEPLAPIPHVDVYMDIARSRLRLHSKRLAAVQEFLETDDNKTPISYKDWVLAASGDKKALKEVRRHCYYDITTLEEVYDRLAPLHRNHPRINGYGPCTACGSEQMQSRGYSMTKQKGWKHRFQCQSCGKWEDRAMGGEEFEAFLKKHPHVKLAPSAEKQYQAYLKRKAKKK